jgi:carboxypeptidase family protein
MRGLGRGLCVLLFFMAMSSSAYAQATLAGTAKDASGAVLPGVTVEAASDVLIEKTRTALTDGTGRYQIVDLRPGAYTVTYTLNGFATVKRENVQLTGTATIMVDVEMRVGNVAETVTVTGETPIVDVQTTRRQTVLDQQVVTAIPTSRNSFSVGVLIPGVSLAFSGTLGSPNNAQDVGGSLGPSTESLSAHGSRLQDQRQAVNGVALSTMIGGGWGGGAVPNATGTAEFAIDTAAVDASLATGGPRVNFIPRDGGNRVSSTLYGSFATEGFQTATSVTKEGFPEIRANTIQKNGDFNPGVGGPIVKDKLWFYLSGRYQVANNFAPGMFHNLNANKPNPLTHIVSYNPDLSSPATSPRDFYVYMGRLTWQANPRNKFGLTYDLEGNCFCPDGVSATRTPEAGVDRRFPLQRFVQLDWNSPISSKVLIEASAIHRVERWGGMNLQTGSGDNITTLDPTVIGISDVGLAPPPLGFQYGAATQGLAPGSPAYNNSWNDNWHYRAAISYSAG